MWNARLKLLLVLATMPYEAFGWFVAWTQTGFPDGLGGFQPDSRAAITALKKAGKDYFDEIEKSEKAAQNREG